MKFPVVNTLRRRIQLLLLATLVPVFLLILSNAYLAAQREKREIQQQAYRLVTTVAAGQEQMFATTGRFLDRLAQTTSLPQMCADLSTSAASYRPLASVAIADAHGQLLCAGPGVRPAPIGPELLAIADLATPFGVSGLQTSALVDRPSVVMAQRHAALAGVVVIAAVDIGAMLERMSGIPLPPRSSVAVVARDRIVVARVPDNAAFQGRSSTNAILDEIESRSDGVFETTGTDGVYRLYGFIRPDLPGQPFLITLGIPSAVAYAEVNRRLWTNLGILALVTLFAFLVAGRLSMELFERKIGSVLRAARTISAGDLTARTGEEWSADEVGELARAFDAMAWTLQHRTLELQQSVESLRQLTARLETVREEERTRISREIHDELGQALTGIRMDLDRLESRLRESPLPADARGAIDSKVESARTLVDAASGTARRISRQLRPSVLDVLGFRAAVEWQLDDFRERTDADVELLAPEELPLLDEPRAVALFRVLQETLTNVMRHAKATQVTVRLATEAGELVMEVMDNGSGFTPGATATGHLGLLGMRERVAALGGSFNLSTAPGRGTAICVRLPLTVTAEP